MSKKISLVLFDPEIGPYQVLPLRPKVDLGAMAMKEYSPIPHSSSITEASLSCCLVSYAEHSLGGVLPFCRDAVGVFYCPSRLDKWCKGGPTQSGSIVSVDGVLWVCGNEVSVPKPCMTPKLNIWLRLYRPLSYSFRMCMYICMWVCI